jgi:hypothetical protein
VLPLAAFADADGVDVGIDGDEFFTLARLANLAEEVAETVHPNLVERAGGFHFLLDAFDDRAFFGRLGGDGYHVSQEADHGLFVFRGGFVVGALAHEGEWNRGCLTTEDTESQRRIG